MHALYCQACNHDLVQSVHGSWNFFPWHRAFLYYFERILGSLVGDINNFRLPYWDWENHRSIPSIYLSPASSTNSLYDVNRYAALASGGSLPTNDGTAARISVLDGITDFATFGGTATAGGACESNPHDPIHDDVGLHTSPWHDMGHLGFAARDPVFFGHHCNLDKIWANWNALAAKSTPPAYQNPTDPAFLSERWNFYDENQKIVSISAADVLNFSTNLRYTYTPPPTGSPYAAAASTELAVPDAASGRTAPVVNTFAARLVQPSSNLTGAGVRSGPTLDVTYAVKRSVIESAQQQSSVAIVLRGVKIPENATGVFDIMSAHGSRLRYLGTLAVVGNTMRMGTLPKTVVLDATEALQDLFDTASPGMLIIVPREGNDSFTLKAEDAELRVITPR